LTHARRLTLAFLILIVPALAQTPVAATAAAAVPPNPSIAALGVRPEVLPWDDGQAGLDLLFKKLKNTGRIMHLTAHPDDEDGPLLTYLARGQGRQVLLMSLTRGEGGQNRTGSNLWDELGVLRTLELLESTRYYGAELRFSRVADFGYSKSADETFKKWGGHEVPLRDIVYVIREWKPDVLFTRFSGTPRDGHGMHQASAILAPEAVKCATDPKCFPDQLQGPNALTTWQVLKLYMGNQGGDYTVRYDVSQIDPDTKMSYAQMALEGFKHQASQLSGDFKYPTGPNWRSYKLVYSALPKQPAAGDKEQDFFDGIDTSVSCSVRCADDRVMGAASSSLRAAETAIKAGEDLKSAKDLLRARLQLINALKESSRTGKSSLEQWAQTRYPETIWQLSRAATFLTHIQTDATAKQPFIEPGSRTVADVTLSNRGSGDVQVGGASVVPSTALVPSSSDARYERLAAGSAKQKSLTVSAAGIPLTEQHWFRSDPETDTVYQERVPQWATLPLPPNPFVAAIDFSVGDEFGTISAPIFVDGPKPSRLAVANPLSVLFDRTSTVRQHGAASFPVSLTVHSISANGPATIAITAPSGWKVQPDRQQIQLKPGQDVSNTFTIAPTDGVGKQALKASVEYQGKQYDVGYSTVTRPDLDTFYYYQPATQRVSIVDVNVPKNLRVGYIPGAGDDIFPVLQQLGLNAKLISNDELANGNLHQYDTIIVGIRGYDERKEIRDNNQRLLDFVKDGGTLLVQNQKAEDVFNGGKFTPYTATLGRERVSVEEAPVQVLAPNDSVFNSPNKITQADFDRWVQERGINFMSQWDDHFEPLLASSDPGEQPLKGGLLRAKYGKGTYIYTGYAFFRQLPAGVPGAVRLYVNLLNAGHETK
jgi:LmbE family N-acetylglucosaminyl deacetylase